MEQAAAQVMVPQTRHPVDYFLEQCCEPRYDTCTGGSACRSEQCVFSVEDRTTSLIAGSRIVQFHADLLLWNLAWHVRVVRASLIAGHST